MATRASGPPARLTNAERMSLSRSLSSAPPMAITGPAVTMPSGPNAAGSVATLSLIALPATPAPLPHAYNRRRGSLPRRYPVSMRVTATTLQRGAVISLTSRVTALHPVHASPHLDEGDPAHLITAEGPLGVRTFLQMNRPDRDDVRHRLGRNQ